MKEAAVLVRGQRRERSEHHRRSQPARGIAGLEVQSPRPTFSSTRDTRCCSTATAVPSSATAFTKRAASDGFLVSFGRSSAASDPTGRRSRAPRPREHTRRTPHRATLPRCTFDSCPRLAGSPDTARPGTPLVGRGPSSPARRRMHSRRRQVGRPRMFESASRPRRVRLYQVSSAHTSRLSGRRAEAASDNDDDLARRVASSRHLRDVLAGGGAGTGHQ